MAISHIGTSSAVATTITVPAHVAGDLMVIVAASSAGMPSLPAGWTNIYTATSAGGNNRCAYKIATGTTDTSGTWTGAQMLSISVFRGTHATTPIGVVGTLSTGSGGAGSTVSIPGLTGSFATNSWVHWLFSPSSGRALSGVPASLTMRVNVPDAQQIYSTNAAVTSWPATSATAGAPVSLTDWRSNTFEIRDASPTFPATNAIRMMI